MISNNSPSPQGLFFRSVEFWTAASALWTACVLGLAVSPQSQNSWAMEFFGDKILHAFAFAVGTGCWVLAVFSNRKSLSFSLFGVLVTAAIGLLIEWLQGFVPGREQDGGDLLADLAGIAVALAVLLPWLASKTRQKSLSHANNK